MPASNASFLFSIEDHPNLVSITNFCAFESVSDIYVLQLGLASLLPLEDYDGLIGSESLLTIINDYDHTRSTDRYFHGTIRKLEYVGSDGDYFLYEAEMVPKFWQLSLRKNCRIFQETTTQKIIKQLLEENGINSDHYRFALVNENRDRGFCVQYNETDFDFINRLLEEEGICYFFEHFKNKHVIVFLDDRTMHDPIKGDEVLLFNKGGMEGGKESIYSFTYSQRMKPGVYIHRNFNFKKTSLDLTAKDFAPNKESFEVFEYPALHTTQSHGNVLAKTRAEELTSMQKQGNGYSTSCRLLPGFTFTLDGHESKTLNTDYLIVSTIYSGEQPQSLEESAGDGFSFDVEFTVTPASAQFRPARTKEKPFIKGVQTATVVGPKGEEIHTDEHGRIRVQFHWDREGQRDDRSSCWLRVSQAWGGGSWGSQFVPRIGDEVLVDFLEGDPDRPIVTGCVYNGDNQPINNLKKSITQSGFMTKTHKGDGFHELRFDDAKGSEEIFLHSQKDWNIMVQDRKGQTVGGDSGKVIAGNCDKSVGGDKYTLVKGKDIKRAKEITIAATDNITLVCGASSIIITPEGIHINNPKQVHINDGSSAPMPPEQPVSGCTGSGRGRGGTSKHPPGNGNASGGKGSGKTSGDGKEGAKPASPKPPADVQPDAKPVPESEPPQPDEDWSLGSMSASTEPQQHLRNPDGTEAASSVWGQQSHADLNKELMSKVPKAAQTWGQQSQTDLNDMIKNASKAKLDTAKNYANKAMDDAKGEVLQRAGITDAQNEAAQELDKLRELLKSPKTNADDLLKKF